MNHEKSQTETKTGCCGGCKNAANGSCKSIRMNFDLDQPAPIRAADTNALRETVSAVPALFQ